MKKKNIIISVVIVIVVLLGVWLLTRPKTLGSMNHSYSEVTTSNSDFSFTGETGDKIKFSFASKIENGDLDILLYDSKGNMVYKLDRARRLETFFTLEDTDTYTLVAEYSNFSGNFKIKVYSETNY